MIAMPTDLNGVRSNIIVSKLSEEKPGSRRVPHGDSTGSKRSPEDVNRRAGKITHQERNAAKKTKSDHEKS